MSYTLHLWKAADTPQLKLPEVEATLESLRAQRLAAPLPEFQEALEQVYDYYDASPDEDLPDVWNEAPEPGLSPLLVLGLVSGELSQSLPVIHAAAAASGLIVYDGQADELRWPDGWIEDPRGRRQEVAPPLAELSQELQADFSDFNIARYLKQQLAPVLATYGFRPSRGEWWFEKSAQGFITYFYGRVHHDVFSFWAPIYLKTPRGRPELAKYCTDGSSLDIDFPRVAGRHGLPLSGQRDGNFGAAHKLQVKDWTQVRAAASELCSLLQTSSFALLADIKDLAALDHWTNRVPDEDCPFQYIRGRTLANGLLHLNNNTDLMVAYLAGRPEFLTQTQERLNASKAGDEITRRAVPRIQALLDTLGPTLNPKA